MLGQNKHLEGMDRIIDIKQKRIPLLKGAKNEIANSDERLEDPLTKILVIELLESKGISVIKLMSRDELQSIASKNESLAGYTADQLLADCIRVQEKIDVNNIEEKVQYEKMLEREV